MASGRQLLDAAYAVENRAFFQKRANDALAADFKADIKRRIKNGQRGNLLLIEHYAQAQGKK